MRLLLVCLPLCLLLAACQRQVVESWPDGSPRRSGREVDGLQAGTWVYRDRGGHMVAVGGFQHSLQDGPWIYRHDNDVVAARGSYRYGLKEGAWTYWRPDGSRRASGSYAYDRQEGVWTSYAADGGTAALAWYSHGLAHGPWVEFAGDATVSAGIQVAGVRVGPWLVAGVNEDCPLPGGWTRHDAGGVTRLSDGDGRMVAVIARDGARLHLATPGRVVACDVAARVVAQVDEAVELTAVEQLLFGAAPATGAQRPASGAQRPASSDQPPATIDPPQPTTSMSAWSAPAAAPLPLPAGLADTPLPAPAAMALEPVAILPGLWTTDQEAQAGSVIARFRGEAPDNTAYVGEAPRGASRARPVWHGKPLPQARFLGTDGQILDLARWRGSKVAVVVMRGFSGQVCLYCAAQTAALAEAAPRLKRDAGCEILVVYPGPAEAVPAFLKAAAALGGKPAELPVALDPGLHLVRKLELSGNLALPATFLLDRDGVVRWTYVGTSIADRPSVRDIEQALAGIK